MGNKESTLPGLRVGLKQENGLEQSACHTYSGFHNICKMTRTLSSCTI